MGKEDITSSISNEVTTLSLGDHQERFVRITNSIITGTAKPEDFELYLESELFILKEEETHPRFSFDKKENSQMQAQVISALNGGRDEKSAYCIYMGDIISGELDRYSSNSDLFHSLAKKVQSWYSYGGVQRSRPIPQNHFSIKQKKA